MEQLGQLLGEGGIEAGKIFLVAASASAVTSMLGKRRRVDDGKTGNNVAPTNHASGGTGGNVAPTNVQPVYPNQSVVNGRSLVPAASSGSGNGTVGRGNGNPTSSVMRVPRPLGDPLYIQARNGWERFTFDDWQRSFITIWDRTMDMSCRPIRLNGDGRYPPQVGGGSELITSVRSPTGRIRGIAKSVRIRAGWCEAQPEYSLEDQVEQFVTRLNRWVTLLPIEDDVWGKRKKVVLVIHNDRDYYYRSLRATGSAAVYEADDLRFEPRWMCEGHVHFRAKALKETNNPVTARCIGLMAVHVLGVLSFGIPHNHHIDAHWSEFLSGIVTPTLFVPPQVLPGL